MFLSLDGTFWIQLINFAIFFAILNVVFLRPVGAAIKKRRAYIDGVKSDYDRYAEEGRGFRSQADQKRAAARRQAEERVTQVRLAAEREAAAEIAAETAKAEAIVDEARAIVAREMQAAKSREGELTQSLARTLLERATGGRA
ncbi:MAG: ATP synthase F0 subunit B [Candidatus Eremiobacteraeota bacterium]|nr:ATP synthase F0 subunit B [Candidatus Eremiobacteraeota bacterium]